MVAITLNPTENSLSVMRSDENMSYLPRSQEELGCLGHAGEGESPCDHLQHMDSRSNVRRLGGRVRSWHFSTDLTRCLDGKLRLLSGVIELLKTI